MTVIAGLARISERAEKGKETSYQFPESVAPVFETGAPARKNRCRANNESRIVRTRPRDEQFTIRHAAFYGDQAL